MFKKSRRNGILAGIVILSLAIVSLGSHQIMDRSRGVSEPRPLAPSGADRGTSVAPVPEAAPQAAGPNGIIVGHSYKHDVSRPLREIPAKPVEREFHGEEEDHPSIVVPGQQDHPDGAVQNSLAPSKTTGSAATPTTGTTFEGIGNSADGLGGCACIPPDTNGDVSATQYVQTVNSAFAVYNKTGGTLLSPRNINTIWTGFGGACEANNDGDPVALYDAIAKRWLVSQFTASAPYDECIAISTGDDATGAWYRYAFQLSTTDFPDYPHLGVWPDGYYMSVNWFNGGSTYNGPRPYVFDRTAMLAGQPATFQTTGAPLGSSVSPIMPSDLDGATLPPSGAPNVFVGFGSSMPVYKFHADFANAANTTWGRSATLTPAGFTKDVTNVPQRGTTQTLDNLADRLMHRMAYRNFGTYQALVVNHTVDVGNGRAGVRWYEIRNPAGVPTIYQQGSFAPGTDYRWMGSAAQDKVGDIAIGFSASSPSVYPSIRYAARVPSDPAGTLSAETTLLTGNGSQGGYSRWGDYSSLTVDPANDCTFWFTTEYNNSGTWHWRTKIGSFKLAGCQ